MEVITSVKNPIVLKTKEYKDNPKDRIFLENPKNIEEAFNLGLDFDYVLVDEKKIDDLRLSFSFFDKVKLIYVNENIIKKLSDLSSPQGVIAIVQKKEDYFDEKLNNNFLVLENIQDPGNLGTIIRSARGANFNNIFLINCVCPYNQKVIRSSMGGIFYIKFHFFENTNKFIDFSKTHKLNLIVADMNGENLFTIKEKFSDFVGVVMGNEGNGVSKTLKNFCQKKISIPMKNNLESLNVAVASSIIMYYLDNLK